MKITDSVQNAYAMSPTSPSFLRGPYHHGSSQILIITFVSVGVTRVLPTPAPVTLGARIMFFPGVIALWPYVLMRWLKSCR